MEIYLATAIAAQEGVWELLEVGPVRGRLDGDGAEGEAGELHLCAVEARRADERGRRPLEAQRALQAARPVLLVEELSGKTARITGPGQSDRKAIRVAKRPAQARSWVTTRAPWPSCTSSSSNCKVSA